MWHLIRLNNKKDKDLAESKLKESGLSFLPILSLISVYQTNVAAVSILLDCVKEAYLVADEQADGKLNCFLKNHKNFFVRVRCKKDCNGHVKLSQEELDQFILTLQIPQKYQVLRVKERPNDNCLKDATIPFGPLQGLAGAYLNTKTPGGKRFFVRILNLFDLEIRVPIQDIKKNRRKAKVELSYMIDEQSSHWYLLSSTKKSRVETMLGDTVNVWDDDKDVPLKVMDLHIPGTNKVVKTIRYLYQAIYRAPSKNGDIEEVNVMPHYYFFRTNRYDLETFRGSGFDSHIYIIRNSDGSPMRIPDAQMEAFRKLLVERSEATNVLYEDFKAGDVVQVTMGVESNNEIEGTIQIVTKKHYILLSENGFKINVRRKKRVVSS